MNRYEQLHQKRHDAIRDRIRAAAGLTSLWVSYCCHDDDDWGLPKDNLDEIAISGPVKVVHKPCTFFGNGVGFESEVMESPTWLQLAVQAERQIRATEDFDHNFLEGFDVVSKRGGVTAIELSMGS